MAKLPVSVCIIAKNEEKHIGQCLKSLLKYNMEIVVADTGSTDQTKEIAAKYTDKLYDFEWCDDFAAARNFAVSKASNNWILILDCDEYVQDMDVAGLRTCMQKYARRVGVMEIMNVYTDEGSEGIQIDEVPRFFNKNFYEYRFRIHEQITPKKSENYDEIMLESFHIPVQVKHYGYDIPREEMLGKQRRNLRLLIDSLGENEGMDDYIYFQIGQSCSVLEEYERAIEAYDMCLEINCNPEKKFIPLCLGSYAECLMRLGRPNDAYRLLDINRSYVGSTKLKYMFGKAAHMCRDYQTAIGFLTGITDAQDFEQLGENVFDVYSRIFAIYTESGDMEKIGIYKKKLSEFAKKIGKTITFSEWNQEGLDGHDRSDEN